MQKCYRALAIAFVLSLVHILNDQNIVLYLKGVSVKLLTANVADADVDVVAAGWVGYAANELRLAIEEYELNSALDVIECNAAHGTPMTHILLR